MKRDGSYNIDEIRQQQMEGVIADVRRSMRSYIKELEKGKE